MAEKKTMTRTRKSAAAKEVAAEKPVKEVKKKREFKETDGILCRSVTSGLLVMVGKRSGMKYEWPDYGLEYEIEYRDLVIAVRTRSSFVFGPMFIIEDEEFLEEFPVVKKFYDESYNVAELDAILYLPLKEMKDKLLSLPPVAAKSFQSLAAKAVEDKRLDSLEKIRMLDEMYGINLMLLSEG